MMVVSRYDTDAIAENVPGRVFAFDIRPDGEGSQALVASHDGDFGLDWGQRWWVSRLELRSDGAGGVIGKVTYQQECDHPFHAGTEYRDLEETMPAEEIDPPPPKGTVERRRYDQQMREAYHELMKDHSES